MGWWKKAKLPLVVRIIQWICGALGAILASGIIKAVGGEDGVTLKEAYHNAGILFWVAGLCLAVWLILTIIGNKKSKDVSESAETDYAISSFENITETISQELQVPTDAKEVDVLGFRYKLKNDEVKAVTKGMEMTPYNNFIFQIYKDEECIYLANLDGKYAFPLTELRGIHMVKKNISIPDWNKDTHPNKNEYKKYKLTVDQYGCIHLKSYYILEIEHEGKFWGIYFPNYELPVFEALTGLVAN